MGATTVVDNVVVVSVDVSVAMVVVVVVARSHLMPSYPSEQWQTKSDGSVLRLPLSPLSPLPSSL